MGEAHPTIETIMKKHLNPARFILPVVSVIFALLSMGFGNPMAKKTIHTPSGRFEITFTLVKGSIEPKRAKVDPDTRALWRISFFDADGLVRTVNFRDPGDKKALTEADIYRRLVFSPKDDFVIVPPEVAGTAPRAIALSKTLKWKETPFEIEEYTWLDDLKAVGDKKAHCSYGVYIFDGERGAQVPVKKSESPIGYEMLSIEGKTATIKMFLDECRMQDIPAKCFSHDLASDTETPIQCPGKKGKR
ncbi:MAG: hypothetical protein HYV24_03375 [Deltaproteobacteria bacterium]|nr:hypothetical protein [Deltaproteobacteria bacterium]